MFWSIFFNSVILILAILVVGWGISRLVENIAKKKLTANEKGE